MAPKRLKPGAAKSSSPNEFEFIQNSETWRFYAYLAFWGMCTFAIIITNTIVKAKLAAGPVDENACPPFERNDPDYGVYPGKGFDVDTKSHLNQYLGSSNICVNWDYSPARELTAMVYPLFEYCLIVYLFLDFVATTLAHQRGELKDWFWIFSKIVFPINIFLCSQFRMIFVCIAYESVQQHTAGFLGLQIALVLVALQNAGFVWDTNIAYAELRGPKEGLRNTRIAVGLYLVGDLVISAIKITATVYVVVNGKGAPWIMKDSIFPGRSVGMIVDIIWMIFNAVAPIFISYFRSKHEEPIKIKFSQESGVYIDDEHYNNQAETLLG